MCVLQRAQCKHNTLTIKSYCPYSDRTILVDILLNHVGKFKSQDIMKNVSQYVQCSTAYLTTTTFPYVLYHSIEGLLHSRIGLIP